MFFQDFLLPVFGLSCDMRSVQYQYDQNDIVFEGKVVSKNYFPGSETANVTFEIQTVFKGNPPNPLTIISSEGLYGFKFREEKYLHCICRKNRIKIYYSFMCPNLSFIFRVLFKD